MTQAEFDAAMPTEFWREVVDRVAVEVPDTLLLAEAFWLLEGYFVRTLGMHRVYNSRVHAHAPRRGQRGLPEGAQGDPRVRSRDPQALRQLHEQPRREVGGRAVRQGRQVLRRRDAARDAARAADVRARPVRGVRREVRHGVPPGVDGRAARPVADRAPRARDRAAPPSAGRLRRGAQLPAVRRHERRRGRRRARVRLFERVRPVPIAGRVPQPLCRDVRLDPGLGRLRAQGGRRFEVDGAPHAGGGARAGRRPGGGSMARDPRAAVRARVPAVGGRDPRARRPCLAPGVRDARVLGAP